MDNYELIKANLNLYAVLKNLEEIIEFDDELNRLCKSWNISIQFSVKKGPSAYVEFKNGKCQVGRGKYRNPTVSLFFLSPAHLNKMFEGTGNPIPLKGFTKLNFLAKEFSKVTDKLTYYLKPEEGLLADRNYLELNTKLTLNTAAYAIRELALYDPMSKKIISNIRNGAVGINILPDVHQVNVTFNNGEISASKGKINNPMAVLSMKNIQVANDFLNGTVDTFTAIALGDVLIKGNTPMLDNMSLILERIPRYLN